VVHCGILHLSVAYYSSADACDIVINNNGRSKKVSKCLSAGLTPQVMFRCCYDEIKVEAVRACGGSWQVRCAECAARRPFK
jgi:hypothetical protein